MRTGLAGVSISQNASIVVITDRRRFPRRWCASLAGFALSLFCQSALAQSYAIEWFSVAGGGGTISSGPFELGGTIGQPAASELAGGGFTLQSGFWNDLTDSLQPLLRDLPVPWLAAGAATNFVVSLHVNPSPGITGYTITEQAPAGWQVSGISDGGIVANSQITWTLADGLSRNLSYTLSSGATPAGELVFSGNGTFSSTAIATGGRSVIPVLPHAREAKQIGGDLYVFGQDDASDGDIITVDPGAVANQVNVTFRTVLQASPSVVSVDGVTGRMFMFGQRGDDDLRVSDAITLSAELHGGPGNDALKGGSGNDFLFGEEGNDFVISSPGFDTFSGGPGQDGVVFYGTPGDDDISVHWYLLDQDEDPHVVVHPPFPHHHDGLRVIINGVAQVMEYTPQDDFETIVIYGGAGNDRIVMADDAAAQHWNAEFYGEEGNDILIGARNLSDKPRGNDRLYGGPGDDQLFGYSGNDLLDGGEGHDFLNTGNGLNRVLTDGADELTINARDALDLVATYSGTRSATIDWGDGTTEAATVESATGKVTGTHQYDLASAGTVTIVIATVDGVGAVATHLVPATVTSLPLDQVPGSLKLLWEPAGGLQVSFPGMPGDTYIIQATGDLGQPDWQQVGKVICNLDGTVLFDLPAPGPGAIQFFRAIAEVDLPGP